jgi:Ni/Co efflux regulator RcnB
MKTTLLALGAAAMLAAPAAALAQTANEQAQSEYQAAQAQYQDQKAQNDAAQAQYQDQKAQSDADQAQYRHEKRAYHHELARWAAGQPWPQRYWGDRYVVTDWSGLHLHDPGVGYHWYRDGAGNYVRVADGTHVIEEVYVR